MEKSERSRLSELAKIMNWNEEDIGQFCNEVFEEICKNRCSDTNPNDKEGDDTITTLSKQIDDILINIGISRNLSGYMCLATAIEMAVYNPGVIYKMMKNLYPEISRRCNVTEYAAASTMRYAIMNAWYHPTPLQEELFGEAKKLYLERPTNSMFIATIANYLRKKNGIT